MSSSSTLFLYQTPIMKRSRDEDCLPPLPPPPRKKRSFCTISPTNENNVDTSSTPVSEDLLIPLLDQFDLEMTTSCSNNNRTSFPKMRPRKQQQQSILPSSASGKENHRPFLAAKPSLPPATLRINILPPCA